MMIGLNWIWRFECCLFLWEMWKDTTIPNKDPPIDDSNIHRDLDIAAFLVVLLHLAPVPGNSNTVRLKTGSALVFLSFSALTVRHPLVVVAAKCIWARRVVCPPLVAPHRAARWRNVHKARTILHARATKCSRPSAAGQVLVQPPSAALYPELREVYVKNVIFVASYECGNYCYGSIFAPKKSQRYELEYYHMSSEIINRWRLLQIRIMMIMMMAFHQ